METVLTENALLDGRVRLLQPSRGYRVAVDSVLLAAAVHPRPGDRVLDLGAGVGAVGLCLARRVPNCSVVGIELQPALAELARRNATLNGLEDRLQVLVHDLAQPLPAGLDLFEQVVSNPPFLAAAVADPSPDPSKALATVESSADLGRWLEVAIGALKPTGTLTLIHRSDRLEEIAEQLTRLGCRALTVKRLPPAARVLVRARRAETASRSESPALVLHRPEGGYTAAAEAILRGASALDF